MTKPLTPEEVNRLLAITTTEELLEVLRQLYHEAFEVSERRMYGGTDTTEQTRNLKLEE